MSRTIGQVRAGAGRCGQVRADVAMTLIAACYNIKGLTKFMHKGVCWRRLIDNFNHKNVVLNMARRASGDCTFLTPRTQLSTVYDQRPETCRLHQQKKSP